MIARDMPCSGAGRFSAYDCDVISPELPCGAAWLASCLIELGVAVWDPWGLENHDEWRYCGGNSFQFSPKNHGWKTLFPGLEDGRKLHFKDKPLPRFHHALPGVFPEKPKILLFIRDPRDCLYSAWRRSAQEYKLELSSLGFASFINSIAKHHPLSLQRYLLQYLNRWQTVVNKRADNTFMIVRFEDYKHDPERVLRSIVAFMSINSSEMDIQAACAQSNFTRAHQVEKSLPRQFRAAFTVNRAGIAYEYRWSYDLPMHQALSKDFAPYLEWLGYEPLFDYAVPIAR